jgi:hypothetical protein
MTTGQTVRKATQDELLAEFARAYRKHEEENENLRTASELGWATTASSGRLWPWSGRAYVSGAIR